MSKNKAPASKLHPIDLACFERVANVIGHDAAVYELQSVLDSGVDIDKEVYIFGFIWRYTPQGHEFWRDISMGTIPIEYSQLKSHPKITELPKDKQIHFATMLEKAGYPPEGATHVDFDDGAFFDYECWLKIENGIEYFWTKDLGWVLAIQSVQSTKKYPIPQKPCYDPADVGFTEKSEEEYTGGSVSYYKVQVDNPTTIDEPYSAECNDIIEALQMNYAEGNAFKAIWRKCAARLGNTKKGYTDGLYDSEKVVFFGQRMVEQCKAENKA